MLSAPGWGTWGKLDEVWESLDQEGYRQVNQASKGLWWMVG